MASGALKRAAGPRPGTATTAEGRATVARILEVTRELLTSPGVGELSMRSVADRAGLHLANVQYYFKTRNDLVHALIQDTGARYQQSYDELNARIGDDPVARFRAIVRFNIEDVFKRETRALFLRFWALMNELDDYSGRMLGELYAINTGQLSRALAAIYPLEAPEEILRRTTMIAALTEGLMMVRGARTARSIEGSQLIDRAFETAMTLAQSGSPATRLSKRLSSANQGRVQEEA
jgi:AcrR family transcriptional regulator